MRRKSLFSLIGLAVILVFAFVNYYIESQPLRHESSVTRVIDGDTIVIEGGERVRLLDIDTPERGEPCYSNATNRLKELIDGKEVILEKRGEDKDVYDRLLRYVFLNNTLVNLVMVREGWANMYVVNKNEPYYSLLVSAEQAAKKEKLCVWT